jgi:hypothetical protein
MAMITAGFTNEEAKDERRRSNVRQKVHRLNKGTKRAVSDQDLIEGERAHQKARTQDNEIEIDNAHIGGLPPHPLLSSPLSMPVIPLNTEGLRSNGSPRVERAARKSIDNPKLTVEEAMKCSGYSLEEAKDKRRQNNIRQKKRRIKEKMKSQNNDHDMNIPENIRQIQQQLHQIFQQQSHIQHHQFQIQQQLNSIGQALQLTHQSLHSMTHFSEGNGHAPQPVNQVMPVQGVITAPHERGEDDSVPI